jgi:hypothetical protein
LILQYFVPDDNTSNLYYFLCFKTNCPSTLDTVGIHVPTGQIREFSTISVSSALNHCPSARYAIAVNNTGLCRLFDISSKNKFSLEDSFLILQQNIYIEYICSLSVALFLFHSFLFNLYVTPHL